MNLTKIERKRFRVRNKLKNVSSKNRFRLCVSRSTRNISAQIIDDSKNITLISASSNKKDVKSQKKTKKELSTIVAEELEKRIEELERDSHPRAKFICLECGNKAERLEE